MHPLLFWVSLISFLGVYITLELVVNSKFGLMLLRSLLGCRWPAPLVVMGPGEALSLDSGEARMTLLANVKLE